MSINNGYEAGYALGSTGVRSMTEGTVEITGSLTALFESVALYNKFVENTTSSLEFTLVAGTKSMSFLMPKVKYTVANIPVEGDGPVSVEMEFEALFDSTEGTTLKITRVNA
jgi:hypothetical protein